MPFSKTETKRELYEEGLETITQHCLELMGRPVPDEIEIVWPDPLPVNDVETAEAGLALLASRVIDKPRCGNSSDLDSDKIEERLAGEAATGDNIGTRLLAAFERGANASAHHRRHGSVQGRAAGQRAGVGGAAGPRLRASLQEPAT